MRLKAVSGIMLTLLLIGMLTLAFNIQPVKASGTIYIRADGSVEGTTYISTVDNITYTFTGNVNDSIVVERDNVVVDGVGYTLQGTGSGIGIDLTDRSNVTIKNMEINDFYYGIILQYSSNNTVSGNNITANVMDGIWLSNSLGNTIFGNNITNNGYYGLILRWYSKNNTISGNNVTNNHNDGIYISESYENTISENNITNNRSGISVGWSSNNNTVSGNNVTNNDNDGIYIGRSSNNNIISGNNVTNNDCGIYLYTSSINTIYHNSFIDNTFQAHVTTGYVNTWDNGYPSGGNYWSDYIGVDSHSGPYQNVTGSDGIGDTPYVIDANNQDNYPIVKHTLTIYSSPTGVTFTVDGVPRTTPWSETYSENASVSLIMPETLGGFGWSHWLEDGDTNRTKTVTVDTKIVLTAIFVLLFDLNDDGVVDIDDVMIPALAFGSYPGHPNWNPIADLTGDELVDIDDFILVAIHFGEHI